MPEPPYGEIVDLLKKGQVIPFLGAGVNFGARPSGASWDEKTSAFLPSGAELSRFLADKIRFPSKDEHDLTDLAKVASYFVETSARQRLRERLQKIFDTNCAPSDIHTYLAEVSRDTPLLIVTTNYDDLTEQAFKKSGRPYDLVIYPTDRQDVAASVLWWKHGAEEPLAVPPNNLIIDLEETTVIYKMHGSVDRQKRNWDSYVITEEDYVDFLSRMINNGAVPALFMRHFHTRHFLFLGYGLRDWNLRVVLKNLRAILPAGEDDVAIKTEGAGSGVKEAADLRSWAIQYRPSELEIELWNARQVKIYDVQINEFVKGLRDEGCGA
jgi:hypothetical protein